MLIVSNTRLTRGLGFAVFLALTGVACQGNLGGPVSPSASPIYGTAASPYGGEALRLTEVTGSVPAGGAGIMSATQTNEPGANNFQVAVNVHGAPPDTDLYFQIVGDTAPATRGDGVCNPAAFPNPPAHAGGADGILHTSAGGAASTHIVFSITEGANLGAFDSGVRSDFKYRVVNLARTFDLRSPCTVLMGK